MKMKARLVLLVIPAPPQRHRVVSLRAGQDDNHTSLRVQARVQLVVVLIHDNPFNSWICILLHSNQCLSVGIDEIPEP